MTARRQSSRSSVTDPAAPAFLALPAPTNRWLEQLLLFADHCRQRYPVLLESELGAVFDDLPPGAQRGVCVPNCRSNEGALRAHSPGCGEPRFTRHWKRGLRPQRSLRYNEGGREDWERHLRITDDDIHRLRLISSHIDFGAFEGDPRFNEWLVITALREPVRRILSLYSYVKGSGDHPHHERIAGGGVEEYLDFLAENPFNTNSQCQMISGSNDADRAFDTLRSRFLRRRLDRELGRDASTSCRASWTQSSGSGTSTSQPLGSTPRACDRRHWPLADERAGLDLVRTRARGPHRRLGLWSRRGRLHPLKRRLASKPRGLSPR